jgi:serine/threonine-protein kinase HipA
MTADIYVTASNGHQVDMCQARGVSPQYKYKRDGGPGAVHIVQTLRMSLAAEIDVHRFVRGLIFNWVIGGTDAHAKNYGLL